MKSCNLPRYSSSIGKMKAHISFKVKYCHPIFLDENVKNKCKEVFLEVFEELKVPVDEIGFDDNHVHFVFDVTPKYALWYIMKRLKGRSSRLLMQEFPYLKEKYFWGSHLWNPSYYFDSLGKNEEQMCSYVKNQPLNREQNKTQTNLVNWFN